MASSLDLRTLLTVEMNQHTKYVGKQYRQLFKHNTDTEIHTDTRRTDCYIDCTREVISNKAIVGVILRPEYSRR